jgi:hypothetical protein
VDRIVAVGDVHGDVDALRSCLRLSSLIDDKDQWIGGNTHFVQVRLQVQGPGFWGVEVSGLRWIRRKTQWVGLMRRRSRQSFPQR